MESGEGEAMASFSDKAIRRGFVKKVYSIISVQVFKGFLFFYVSLIFSFWSPSVALVLSTRAKKSSEFYATSEDIKTSSNIYSLGQRKTKNFYFSHVFFEYGHHPSSSFWICFCISAVAALAIVWSMAFVRSLRV